MKKRWMKTTGAIVAVCTLLAGCTGSTGTNTENPTTVSGETKEVSEAKETQEQKVQLEDGTYTAEFDTDSSMFHVSEACDGKGNIGVTVTVGSGGGSPSASACLYNTRTTAPSIDKLNGISAQIGGSADDLV